MLWVAALEAQQQAELADAAIGTALQLGAPNVEELRARRVALARQRALLQAQQAYQSLSTQNDAAAVAQARAAVELAPDVASYRWLLINAQLQQGQLADAERSADQALQADGGDLNARLMRGYLRQRQGKTLLANEDFDAALAAPGQPCSSATSACWPWMRPWPLGTAHVRLHCWRHCRRRRPRMRATHARSSFCSRASNSAPGRSGPVVRLRV